MTIFRSPLLRRIVYAIVLALALTRHAGRSHAEPLPADGTHLAATYRMVDCNPPSRPPTPACEDIE